MDGAHSEASAPAAEGTGSEPARPPRWRAALNAVSPGLAGLLLFTGGAGMLVSAATPQLADRLHLVSQFAPLALIELSHFAGSILATLMLFLAYGLWRRLKAARRAAIALCFAAAPLSLLKGFVWEEAAALVVLGGLLLITREAYYRRSRLLDIRPGGWWITGAVAAIALAAVLGFSAYEHVPYSDELWWTFLIDGDVSRFLRALTGAALVTGVILLWRYAGASHPSKTEHDEETRALAILEGGGRLPPEAWLATTGDKHFLFSASGRSMLMYSPSGDAWIAMGGPAGLQEERRELIWRFREAADIANAWPAFYSVGRDLLPDLLDAGLVLQKVGETAIVPLTSFSMEGSVRAKLRTARAKARREGLTFSMERLAPGSQMARELNAVSDAWLAQHKGAEKRFSLGRFNEAYLARQPIAVMRSAGRIEAFVNLWPGGPGGDIAVDLMRSRPDAPKGVMDALFVELLLWAKAEGYARCDLGMAPLAGLEDRRLAPWLSRVGGFIYRHGGSFYGFEGLRTFKDKFHPVWEPRYLAAPGAWRLSAALGRTALLTTGGLIGMLRG